MQDPDLIALFVAPLEAASIPYLVSGSVATAIYGEPRNTLDIDLAAFPGPSQIEEFPRLFSECDYYLPPVEVISLECHRTSRGHFNIIHHLTGLKADIYPSQNHPYLKWAMANQQRILTPSGQISIAPPEYVILHKLEFYREGGHQKHLRDIAGVIAQQDLNLDFMTTATIRLSLRDEWQKALSLAES